jgi:hypothetical protein
MMYSSAFPDKINDDGTPKVLIDFADAFGDEQFPNTLSKVSPDTIKKIDALIQDSLSSFFVLDQTIRSTYDKIAKAPQLSIAVTANQRTGQGNNNYQAELIYDYGLSSRINWTVNASFNYTDRKSAADSRGGRVATSFEGDLTPPAAGWSKSPLRLSFSGEGDWLTKQLPQYTFQVKLTVPVAAGFDVPIVYQYANRAAQLNQPDSQVRLGLTVDLSRIGKATT